MKYIKIILPILAWVGIGMMLLTICALFINHHYNSYWPVGIIGLFFSLVFGLLARPKYLWIACIATGILYIISLWWIGAYSWDEEYAILLFILAMFASAPGIIAIIEGIILRKLEKRKKIKS